MNQPIYVVDGARTPFLKARSKPGPFAASDLAVQAGRGWTRPVSRRRGECRRPDDVAGGKDMRDLATTVSVHLD